MESWFRTMSTPIVLPDLGVGAIALTVTGWLVDVGDRVEAGDRLLEVLLPGITFDLPAPVSGTLTQIVKSTDAPIAAGDILGWIEAHDLAENSQR
jgi:pyruvate/2-oxoglutarate dehydrogenase complex dihydrolipoamide acyltransferase (E2) component